MSTPKFNTTEPKVTLRAATAKKGARFLVRCGCCKESVEVYPASYAGDVIEINGVLATQAFWIKLLRRIV